MSARPGIGGGEHAPTLGECLVVTAVTAAATVGARLLPHRTAGAVALGGAAGIALGVAAVLVSAALRVLAQHGVVAVLSSAALWCAVVCGVLAEWATQQAFASGALAVSLPTLTVVDPVVAVPAARLLLGEHLARSHSAVWSCAGAVAAIGVVLCAHADSRRSPG